MLVLEGKKGEVDCLAFSPDSRILAASGGKRGLELWDIPTATLWGRYTGLSFRDGEPFFHPTQPVCFASCLHGIAEIKTDTKKAKLLDVRIPKRNLNFFWTTGVTANGSGFVCYLNGSVSEDGDIGLLRWKRGATLTAVWAVKIDRAPHALRGLQPQVIRVAPNGKAFLTLDAASDHLGAPLRKLVQVALRSLRNGERLQTAELPPSTQPSLAISPDSKTFVTCQVSKQNHWKKSSFSVWKLKDLKTDPEKVESDRRSALTGLAFHPSGAFLAVSSNDETVKLYDTTTWQVARTFTWEIGRMRSIAFSPDGTLAAAGSDTGKVVVWDVDV